MTISPGRCAFGTRHILDEADGADRIDLGLARGERVHEPDDASGAGHVAFHILHAGGGLDRDAAGVEADALADEGDRLCLARALLPPSFAPLVPRQRMITMRLSRSEPWPTPSSAPMPSWCISLFIEHFHFDAELFELLGATGEFFGMEYIGRLVDERARDRHAFGFGIARLGFAPRRRRLVDRDRNLSRRRVLIVLFLRLIGIELVVAQPHAFDEFGRSEGRVFGSARQIEGDQGASAGAELAQCIAAETDVIDGLFDRLFGGGGSTLLADALLGRLALALCRLLGSRPGADHEQPIGRKTGWRDNVESGLLLAFEFGGAGRPLDQRLAFSADQLTGRGPEGEILSHEDHESLSGFRFSAAFC